MYRGTTNTRLTPMDPSHSNHGHPHSHVSQGNVGRVNNVSRYPNGLNASPASKVGSNKSRENIDNSSADQNIMHMKKSAEIAAVFSGAKINQTTDILDPMHQHSRANDNHNGNGNRFRQSYHSGQKQGMLIEGNHDSSKSHSTNKPHLSSQYRKLHPVAPQEMFSEADMHSSLGYFP